MLHTEPYKKKKITQSTSWWTVEQEDLSRASGKTRCHGDLVPVAVEMLMKALALGPRRDQRHPGPRCPPDRRDHEPPQMSRAWLN